MNIRVMIPEDYPGVYDLWLHTPGMGLNSLDDSEEGFRRFLKRNPSTCFVAEDGGRIVGATMAGHDGRRGYIYHTAVLQEYRGKRTGRELVRHAMEALEKEGIGKAALVVFARNENGNGFWEQIGFKEREDLVYRNKNIREFERLDT